MFRIEPDQRLSFIRRAVGTRMNSHQFVLLILGSNLECLLNALTRVHVIGAISKFWRGSSGSEPCRGAAGCAPTRLSESCPCDLHLEHQRQVAAQAGHGAYSLIRAYIHNGGARA